MRALFLAVFFLVCAFGANELESIERSLANNTWISKYANYSLYKKLKNELENLQKNEPNNKNKISALQTQIELLKEFENSPFSTLLSPPNPEPVPNITNPLALISGFSQLKNLNALKANYNEALKELKNAKKLLDEKYKILENNESENLGELKAQINDFDVALSTSDTAFSIYTKKIDESIADLNLKITAQIKKSFGILGIVIAVFVVGLVLKALIHHYLQNNQKFYTINKFINITGFVIIIFVLLFAYIENVTYLVTILGFASAGLAIAMKDMFMSLLGWSVIVAGGSFHVGDRVRVRFQNSDIVGDIIDISLLRITLYEDITLTTYRENRRSGRIIFIPNNYIFTETIANYTHGGMKTVWDGIDVLITFESNHKKALYIIKNIVRQYSKGYTDVAKIKMNKLRDQYSIKNTNVEPRIYTIFEPFGINISVWYQTNAYATLALRSTISAEIIDAIKNEPDIKIAFPKETLYLGRNEKAQNMFNDESSTF